MMVNEFSGRNYTCPSTPDGGCDCMYQTPLANECMIAGQGVLDQYGYQTGHTGLYVGILLCIVLVYRLLTWVVLVMKKT